MEEESFFRGDEIGRTLSTLPAQNYNLGHLLIQRSENGCVFVPIRSMQYLAVLDGEEYIFVDREHPHDIELSWRNFKSNERTELNQPVPFEVVYYHEQGHQTMLRLHSEFARALQQFAEKQPHHTEPAKVIPISNK